VHTAAAAAAATTTIITTPAIHFSLSLVA